MRVMNVVLMIPALLAALLLALPACAEPKDPAREQARRAQQMQRKFEQEKSALLQEKTALETQLKEKGDALQAASASADTAGRRASSLTRELAALRSERDALTSKLAAAESLGAERRQEIEKRTANERQLGLLVEQRTQSLGQCESKNLMLYQYGVDLLQRHTGMPAIDPLVVLEPFVGLRQVEMENLMEEYHEKLETQKLGQSQAARGAPAPAAR